jgi:serine/threonine-protein kinase
MGNKLTLGILVLFAVLTAAVGAAQARDNFGAIAYSPDTRGWGTSYDFRSRGAAESYSMSQCGARGDQGCRVVLWFRNACGALAVNSDGANGWGWAYARGNAERIALQNCNAYGGGCWTLAWACTTR